MTRVVNILDTLLDRVVLSETSVGSGWNSRFYEDMAFRRVRSLLRWDAEAAPRSRMELKLRLALHLAPREAISYDRGNPIPRVTLIRDHLSARLDREADGLDELARAIALVLDNWERGRESVTAQRRFLIRRDGNRCRHCKVKFGTVPQSVQEQDEYKPYFHSPEELLSPEVDHIDAISAMGTNNLDNLQLLCRLCNAGKGDGLGLSVGEEMKYAGDLIEDVPVFHRGRLLYYVLERGGAECVLCGATDDELTMRPVVHGGALCRTNLMPVCVTCAYDIG
ncbi:HNH endonuclease [Rhodococcus zopfii]|uniref:HNH endonuclease n=1 Tax=Rhodococcus zopfii TaxID=43772 RepID=UPI00365E5B07